MRYCGNKICPDAQTNKQTNGRGRLIQKYNTFANCIGWQRDKNTLEFFWTHYPFNHKSLVKLVFIRHQYSDNPILHLTDSDIQ